jgi:hypothetical protein
MTAVAVPNDLRAWVQEQCEAALPGRRATLLAEADDGYVWGEWTGAGLALNEDVPGLEAARRLRSTTLHWLRVFAPEYELRAWKSDVEFRHTKWTGDDAASEALLVERDYLLVGGHIASGAKLPGHRTVHRHPTLDTVFTVLRGPALELQAPPGDWTQSRRPCLRTYLTHRRDARTGQWFLQHTRFVQLTARQP